MLLDKISLTAIARGLQISELWLQQGVNHKSKNVLREVESAPKAETRADSALSSGCGASFINGVTPQLETCRSFVDNKGNER